MKTLLLVVYVTGVAVTAVNLRQTQVFRGQYLMSAIGVLLWPLYWSYFLAMLLLDRRRG